MFKLFKVIRNDDPKALSKLSNFDAWIISPGPGLPDKSGCLMEVLENGFGKIPILGVCLGFQALTLHNGGKLIHLKRPQHGKEHLILKSNPNSNLFKNIHFPFQVGLYHSWAIDPETIKASNLTYSESGVLMSGEWENEMAFGIQFHPESIMTPQGDSILKNWITVIKKN
tara:strand:+ start:1108 stop:1617 length:510 start_codon:yes stop_codon:yes gene_type:complete